MDTIARYVWLIAIIALTFSSLRAGYFGGEARLDDPIKDQERRTYGRWLYFGKIAPLIAMGAGIVSGSTPTIWHFFRPQDENPYVLGFMAAIVIDSLLWAWWVLFEGGAEKVGEYRLMEGTRGATHPALLKLTAAIGPFFIAFWIYMLVKLNIPIWEFART